MNINKSSIGDVLDISNERILIVDDDDPVTNSFFEIRYIGCKVLILVQNPADEIFLAGNMILNLSRARAEIFVAFSSNSIFNESAQALNFLNVKSDHIIILNSTNENFSADLKDLILKIEADIIFTVDFDLHSTNFLSTTFDSVLTEILLRDCNDYQPEIYRGFISFHSINDLHSDNLLETKRPENPLIDNANYTWSDRIRFPVDEDCRQLFVGEILINHNQLAKSLFSYHSLMLEKNVFAILNSDEVFFERRTDNLLCSAKIISTSGDTSKLRDFHIVDNKNFLWYPDKTDSSKKLSLIWNCIQPIELIKIYGDFNSNRETKINITINNSKRDLKLPAHGLPLIINENLFSSQIDIAMIDDSGISEIEVFAKRESERRIKPFIKITIDDNFAYDYYIHKDKNRIEFELYRFHIDKEIDFSVSDGVIYYSEQKFILQFDGDDVTVRAEIADEPDIFDQIKIHRRNQFYFWKLKLRQFFDKVKIHFQQKFRGLKF